ncbi:hypothetical protein BHE74_00015160 [Ensete ventricosum]|uniref:Uncharacterized protein n=1 Tax=Ensete ventricosum TaxID=4639 RepID=A0A427A5D3_ENSVE|nr:hypothetical protein B296_00014423 [Ensete ventricosum]RWV84066.1 hypothetical protein GW17_00054248 [Ensete ventricosum]RWW76726.1 hypothetical protein BHE74_00015160 [Ensete ventricosum]
MEGIAATLSCNRCGSASFLVHWTPTCGARILVPPGPCRHCSALPGFLSRSRGTRRLQQTNAVAASCLYKPTLTVYLTLC